MSTNETTETTTNCIQLDAILGIETVAELYERLNQVLSSGGAVSLDGSSVESVDTASLQLLAAFCLQLAEQQIVLDWQEPSEVLCHSAALTGLVDVLQLPHAA